MTRPRRRSEALSARLPLPPSPQAPGARLLPMDKANALVLTTDREAAFQGRKIKVTAEPVVITPASDGLAACCPSVPPVLLGLCAQGNAYFAMQVRALGVVVGRRMSVYSLLDA